MKNAQGFTVSCGFERALPVEERPVLKLSITIPKKTNVAWGKPRWLIAHVERDEWDKIYVHITPVAFYRTGAIASEARKGCAGRIRINIEPTRIEWFPLAFLEKPPRLDAEALLTSDHILSFYWPEEPEPEPEPDPEPEQSSYLSDAERIAALEAQVRMLLKGADPS